MRFLSVGLPVVSTVFFGAIFGFFYAWICSTMWAFDLLDPRIAITTMQEVNAGVRNLVFFPGFMLTPVVGLITAIVLVTAQQRKAAMWFGAATVVYLGGGLLLTMFVNVPMNHDLAAMTVPETQAEAAAIWNAYSPRWQFWNQTRTVFSGIALVLAGVGLVAIEPKK